MFGLVPLLELRWEGATDDPKDRPAGPAQGLLLGMVPVQLALVALLLVRAPELGPGALAGAIVGVGTCCGAVAINTAHELGHRQSRWLRLASETLLASTLYLHFHVEHNQGHHVRVGTPDDPATARMGESVYRFWPRTLAGSLRSGWALAPGRILVYGALQLGLVFALAWAFGPVAGAAFVAAAGVGILLLETVNYLQHYGLVRGIGPDGRPERVSPAHSWTSNRPLSRALLFDLPRHADHHVAAGRAYTALRHHPESPLLPSGYPAMILLALVPPLFRRAMVTHEGRVDATESSGSFSGLFADITAFAQASELVQTEPGSPAEGSLELDPLRGEEAWRARTFGLVIAFLCLAVLVSLPLLGGEPWLRRACAAALIALGSVSLVVVWFARDEARYTQTLFRVYGFTAVAAAVVIQYHLGVFSPTPLSVTLGISFFASGADQRGSIAICGSALVSYLVLAGLVTLGWIPDPGIFSARDAPLAGKVFFTFIVPVVQGVTLVQGRSNRAAAVELKRRVGEVSRVASLEQARYEEVRAELDRALRTGQGTRGLHSGERFGQFAAGGVIGRGGMGEVYEGRNLVDGSVAALKILSPRGLEDDVHRGRFEREGRLTAALDSPHVVRLHQVGVTDQGVPFLAMERLVGQDLAAILRDRRRLPIGEVAELVRQICEGLQAAHDAGMVHRDVKPQNLFWAQLPGERLWKLLDFGIARGLEGETVTQTGLVGTPGYMSPEQTRGMDLDGRSDLFSLGSVAYRALLGRAPFAGPNAAAVLMQLVRGTPIRPRVLAPHLFADVEHVLAIALASDPARRFPDARAMGEAFQWAATGSLPQPLRLLGRRLANWRRSER